MDLSKNRDRFEGDEHVCQYDQFRPQPPIQLINLIRTYVQLDPLHVIDVGCGSGLSTLVWKNIADRITCVDPGTSMLNATRQKFKSSEVPVDFIQAYAHEIPLDSEIANVITVSQAFHWMEPTTSLKEISRLLKHDGILAIYDCIWPPSVDVNWEIKFIELFDKIKEISQKQSEPLMHFFDKSLHLDNVKRSHLFRYVKKIGFHKTLRADADYFIGLAESQGGIQAMRKIGISDEDNGWNKFKNYIAKHPKDLPIEYTLHYDCVLAIK